MCVHVHHVVRVQAEPPVFQVLVVWCVVHLLEHFWQVVDGQFEEELVSLHEHAAGDEEEVDGIDCGLSVGVAVLDAVVAVVQIRVGVLVLAEEADAQVVVRVARVLAERFERRADFQHEQRVELDDREHEEGQGGDALLPGTARRGLESDCAVVEGQAVRHGL